MSDSTARGHRLFYGDKVLWVIIAILSIISILIVFSSTAKMVYDVSSNSSVLSFLGVQAIYLLFSVTVMVALHRVSVMLYGSYAWWIWGACIFLTVLTLFIGSSTNGAARWLPIVGPISIQPSEFLKVAIVLLLSKVLTEEGVSIKTLKLFPTIKDWGKAKNKKIVRGGFLKVTVPIYASVGAILFAHTSSAILVFIVSIAILLIAGVNRMEIAKVVAVAALVGGIYHFTGIGRSDTASGRMETWFATWFDDRTQVAVDYVSDTERSMVAMHSGGIWGKGAGKSAMRVEMIHPESDYAFAFFVEEYGLIFSLMLLLLYLWIFFRAMWIYERCKNPFKELLVINLATLILIQALLHVMVSVNFLPETGQVLPLVSRGGSALFCTYMCFMMMLSVSAKYESDNP